MTLYFKLSELSSDLPSSLQSIAENFCRELSARVSTEHEFCFDHPEFSPSILKVCTCSRFIRETWLRYPDLLPTLLTSGDLLSSLRRYDYLSSLQKISIESEATLSKELRIFRRREMVRIAWRDLANWADLNETLTDLTILAETCVTIALDFLYQQACQRWGTPKLANGKPFNMVVLGMGKIGAWELNFSSDIDLIFTYAQEGVLTEKIEITYGEFFSRICRSLIKALDEITQDGFVFRTDIRLRPFGDSGPLVQSFQGMENYYLTQAREWERYAMIKARQIAGDFDTGKQLDALIKPFVYRRYLDYGAFEELRLLKFQITQELKRKDRMENIKLGPGGIREIEFIAQAFQLIRGGQNPILQNREIQIILNQLSEFKLMAVIDVETLKFAYRFLRRLENHIQQYQDKQSHDLPNNSLEQASLAYSMDFPDWTSFKNELDNIRAQVHIIFNDIFSFSGQNTKQHKAQVLWASSTGDEQGLQVLRDYGFADPDAVLKYIIEFKESYAIRHMTNKGVIILQRLLPHLIEGMQVLNNPDQTLKRILDLLESVAGRNVYLSLLAENPNALIQLIKLSSSSPWICEYLGKYPILFDELMYMRSPSESLDKSALSQELQRELHKVELNDEEQSLTSLRIFNHLNVLRVAAADIMEEIPVMKVSDYLTWIAETILEQVLNRIWLILIDKHGRPPGTGDTPSNYGIIAYGKLGGNELGYGSDLDLVFFTSYPDEHAMTDGLNPISCSQFYLRLTHRVIHTLEAKMLSGVLYQLDLRLRPDGNAGLLVPHISHFENYLRNNAWTWEHQALIRARFIAGDKHLQAEFEGIRSRVLTLNRDLNVLKSDIKEMREKMRDKLANKSELVFDLKQGKGGIVDIEFIIQYGVLAMSSKYSGLTSKTGSIRLLAELQQLGFITDSDASILNTAYRSYRYHAHHQILKGNRPQADANEFLELRTQVQRIWRIFFG